jgi:hypothetical protein
VLGAVACDALQWEAWRQDAAVCVGARRHRLVVSTRVRQIDVAVAAEDVVAVDAVTMMRVVALGTAVLNNARAQR